MNNAQRLLPPHSIESEQSVLGGLMLDNDRWDDIATIVSADNFTSARINSFLTLCMTC